jgi:exodeoxyribonuclease-5
MQLTQKQQEGLEIALARYKQKEPWTCISGYAGTGKSTLVKYIIAALGISPMEVAYVTFTGKAASVLREKGCPNAITAHKLLYYCKRLKNGRYVFNARTKLEYPFKLLVVDEVSMLPKKLWDLLLSHKVHVLALGDPYQLPPIDKSSDNMVLNNPHVFLDEIMRQAKDSEIIQLSMLIRNQQPLEYFKGKEVQVLRKNEVQNGMYLWADQILVATNQTRKDLNTHIRQNLLNYGAEPVKGDKLICLRNNWDVFDVNGQIPLINGAIGRVDEYYLEDAVYLPYLNKPITAMMTNLNFDEYNFFGLPIDYNYLQKNEKIFTPQEEYRIHQNKGNMLSLPIEFDYGYAITCHKAQGSQWDKVMVVEEKFPFNKEEHSRWLYTAVTRAASKLILVR